MKASRRIPNHAAGGALQRGLFTVETTLSSALLLAALFAVFDFGRMYVFQSRLEYAVTHAQRFARTGATLEDPLEPGARLSRADSIALTIAELGGFQDRGEVEIAHVDASGVVLAGTGDAGDIVTVTATRSLEILTPYLAAIFDNGAFTLTAATSFRNEG